jgi:hypothetical protein
VGEGELRLSKRHLTTHEDVVELAEEGGQRGHRLDGGADVVVEAGQGQLFGPTPASGSRCALEDLDREARARKNERRGEPVGTGTHHGGVEH